MGFLNLKNDSYIVWAQEVKDDRVIFISDAKENMRCSRRLVLIYGIYFGFCIVMYISIIIKHLWMSYQFHRVMSGGQYFMIGEFMLVIMEFGYFSLNAIGYYFRMNKKYKEFGDIHY